MAVEALSAMAPPGGPADLWRGDPPDYQTARRWRAELVTMIEAIRDQLTTLRDEGWAVDAAGDLVPRHRHEEWRAALVAQSRTIEDRLHCLNRHIVAGMERRGVGSRLLAKKLAQDAVIPVDAMHAAARRFELLEALLGYCENLMADDTDAAWDAMCDQVEVIQAHGIRPLPGGAR